MRELGAHPDQQQSQRAMVFVDGTNLFYRLEGAKLKLRSLVPIIRYWEPEREIVRVYLYTSQPHYEKALARNGATLFEGIRVVFGEAIPTGDGDYREKGVDALLVADLVYHAAARNYDQAILISSDQDFARALTRVEDFGCRTSVIAVASEVPPLLVQAADRVTKVSAQLLIENSWAEQA
jgi:uncharacterized LabA/DUF88 family protein